MRGSLTVFLRGRDRQQRVLGGPTTEPYREVIPTNTTWARRIRDSPTSRIRMEPDMNFPRIARAAGIGLAVVLALTAVSTTVNGALNTSEHADLVPYGEKVAIDAGDINVYRNGGTGPTMVLLSGYGTPAPAIDFAPLIRQLNAFNVIVVEGFGYGYSDLNVSDRTVENITRELHEVLAKLRVDEPVILVGHSVGGIYARFYANAYPDEVMAIVGVDPTPALSSSLDEGAPSTVESMQAATGLFRLVTTIAPDLVQPPGSAYTAEERHRIAVMTNWNYGNASVSDEWSRIGANSTKAAMQPFATDLPVLEILSSDSVRTMPQWLPNHEAELENVTTHEITVLEGSHYLHWTQSPALARIISEFLSHLSR
ncbi:alpha/beta hydrolase [Cryobacterium sp. MDB2-10]|nr:alpha/beta hydrolase [Cryobacterium sp. MDB2-A-1]TFC04242.1 alpha/beta hydrolase [Cryobacterium sp. MDB2-33-2]TFC14908.1 alpha/beta hydrolase [Cryobacterium sp. MDB2-A-2]TFC16415.1 alpha/beta hydrolase [Cryobacterium sp. MDB2-10]